MSTTSKSPRRVLELALAVGQAELPDYGHSRSPKKFTQPQLFACLVLKEFLKTDYRGVAQWLADCSDLRAMIGLTKAPHYTTLQKAQQRLLTLPWVRELLSGTLCEARRRRLLKGKVALAAGDATGFESYQSSHYFIKRKTQNSPNYRKPSTWKRFPKLALVIDTHTHLILGACYEQGPRNDRCHVKQLLAETTCQSKVEALALDAGYDAEWVHEYARSRYSIRTLIPPCRRGTYRGHPLQRYRRWMSFHLHHTNYSQRWQVETTMSMIKRRTGAGLRARKHYNKRRAALLKAITHNLLILYVLIV